MSPSDLVAFCTQKLSPGVRSKLLFKDGTTQPAAAVSALFIIESALVERAGEGVCILQKITQSGPPESLKRCTFTYLIAASYFWWVHLWKSGRGRNLILCGLMESCQTQEGCGLLSVLKQGASSLFYRFIVDYRVNSDSCDVEAKLTRVFPE